MKTNVFYYFALALLLSGGIYSCQKDSSVMDTTISASIKPEDIPLIKSAKTWHAENLDYVKKGGKSDLDLASLIFEWNKYSLDTNRFGQQVLTVPIVSKGTSTAKYMELGLIVDQEGNANGMIKEYMGNPYVGEMTLNLYTGVGRKFESGWYRADTKEMTVRNMSRFKHGTQKRAGGDLGGTLEEVVIIGYKPIDPPPIIYIPSYPTFPTGPGTTTPSIPVYPGGGGGGSTGGVTSFNILASGPKIDPKTENKCFNVAEPAQLTVYVQEANEGTRDLVGSNEVGHVFVGIKQSGIERYYGFYPESGANSALVAVGKDYKAELRDNSSEMYHVSISKTVTASQLSAIITYANTPPTTYNVNSYACTDFGIAVGKLGGIDLPSTKVSNLVFKGTSPGNLGEDIRNGSFPNTTKSTSKSNAPAKAGSCN
ncbi:MAG: hypothetical protein K0R59_41 [Sphingobacterium sp.]|jgi:hypothetical protein|nr:hypothetical protein [Sphingobacterium sp.]